jgi:uncharacterized protein
MIMKPMTGNASLLRIYIGELDKYHHQPLYEAIVMFAKTNGMAGATVLRGLMSFGANSRIHTARLLALSEDLPIIIEIVDEEEKVREFVTKLRPYFESSAYGGLVTIETVSVIYYKNSRQEQAIG